MFDPSWVGVVIIVKVGVVSRRDQSLWVVLFQSTPDGMLSQASDPF